MSNGNKSMPHKASLEENCREETSLLGVAGEPASARELLHCERLLQRADDFAGESHCWTADIDADLRRGLRRVRGWPDGRRSVADRAGAENHDRWVPFRRLDTLFRR